MALTSHASHATLGGVDSNVANGCDRFHLLHVDLFFFDNVMYPTRIKVLLFNYFGPKIIRRGKIQLVGICGNICVSVCVCM